MLKEPAAQKGKSHQQNEGRMLARHEPKGFHALTKAGPTSPTTAEGKNCCIGLFGRPGVFIDQVTRNCPMPPGGASSACSLDAINFLSNDKTLIAAEQFTKWCYTGRRVISISCGPCPSGGIAASGYLVCRGWCIRSGHCPAGDGFACSARPTRFGALALAPVQACPKQLH